MQCDTVNGKNYVRLRISRDRDPAAKLESTDMVHKSTIMHCIELLIRVDQQRILDTRE